MAALRLGAKPELNCHGRSGGSGDPEHSDEGENRGNERKRNDERGEDDSDHPHYRLGLGAKHAGVCHRCGSDEIGCVLAGDGEPSKTACQLSGRYDQYPCQQRGYAAAVMKTAPQ
jgi:hypothetical protein